MHYYMYQITNKVNGKIYVGVHKTEDIDDGYMGSGKVIQCAIQKHGAENFEKVILEHFENQDAMYAREAEIVNEEFLNRDDVYNLRCGGFGGFDHINKNHMNYGGHEGNSKGGKIGGKIAGNAAFLNKTGIHKNAEQYHHFKHDKDLQKESSLKGNIASQSIDAKKKRKDTMKRVMFQQRENNSQFGTMWITDGFINKKIKKIDLIPNGFRKGRIMGD